MPQSQEERGTFSGTSSTLVDSAWSRNTRKSLQTLPSSLASISGPGLWLLFMEGGSLYLGSVQACATTQRMSLDKAELLLKCYQPTSREGLDQAKMAARVPPSHHVDSNEPCSMTAPLTKSSPTLSCDLRKLLLISVSPFVTISLKQ